MERVLLVTGGSRGIGAATARMAALQGWDVAINYRARAEEALRVQKEIERLAGRAIIVSGDVSREADVARMFDETEKKLGPVTGLVNSAGVLRRATPTPELTLERWNEMFAINVTGTFLCVREALRRMVAGGAIVNLSSIASQLGAAGEFTDYAASKGAVESFTLGVAREVASRGLRVNGVRPGTITTDMQVDSGIVDRPMKVAPSIPMKRPGTADEVAEAIVWLLSDSARYVTGSFIDVTGGR